MTKKNNLLTHFAGFIETMDCLPVTEVPDGVGWTYEIKLDGFRLQAVRTGGEVTLYSRRHNVLNAKFQYIADALHSLPDETVIDGELVALGPMGSRTSICFRTFGRQRLESFITLLTFSFTSDGI